jgi:hypothetical protein
VQQHSTEQMIWSEEGVQKHFKNLSKWRMQETADQFIVMELLV